MADDEGLTVPLKNVNKETLDLLELRLRSSVIRYILGWIGLPIGLFAIAMFSYTVFDVVPQKIAGIMDDPTVKTRLEAGVSKRVDDYLEDENRGGTVIQTQVEQNLPQQLHGALRSYFAGKDGRAIVQNALDNPDNQKTIRDSVGDQLGTFLTSEPGKKLVTGAVETYMGSPAFNADLTRLVNDALKPKEQALLKRLDEHRQELVAAVEKLGAVERFSKGGIEELEFQLDPDRVKQIRQSQAPVALTMNIRLGSRYAAPIIRQYLSRLNNEFHDQFRYVLINDRDGKFLGLLLAADFARAIERHEDQVMKLVNASEADLPQDKARHDLTAMGACVGVVPVKSQIADALMGPGWTGSNLECELPVVADTGEFLGMVTRGRLVHAILE